MAVSMGGEKRALLVKYYLSASLKEALQEIGVLPSEESWHKDIDRVADDLSLAITEDLREALAGLQNLTN
jgi:hypothetical protein